MQVVAQGLVTGLEIALVALAFMIVYLPTRVFHLAMGGTYAAVPYVALAGLKAGLPWPLAIVSALLFGTVLSLLCDLVNHAPLEKKGAGSGTHFVSSLGLYIVFVQGVALIWGNEPQVLHGGVDKVGSIAGLSLTIPQFTTVITSLAAFALFYSWLAFTGVGLQLRALAVNPTETALRGHNVVRLRLVAFGVSGLLCSIASMLTARDVGFDPHVGMHAVLGAVVAVVLGGRESFMGPVLGGILLGLIRTGTVWFLSAGWQEAAVFVVLAVVLYCRPAGVLGRSYRGEATS